MTSFAWADTLAAALPQARQQSLGEEIANSISHGLALLAALVAAPFLVVGAVQRGDAANMVGAGIFAATMVLLYAASMLYPACGALLRLLTPVRRPRSESPSRA